LILRPRSSGKSHAISVLKLVFSLDAEDPRYGYSFLFTEQEVQEFLQTTGSSLRLEELRGYYSSYCARGPGGTSISLFNPWSVHHAIAQGRLACFWNQTSSYNPIGKAIWNRGPNFTNCITKLLAGEAVELSTRSIVTYEDLNSVKQEDIWGLLSYAGYLTPIFVEGHASSTYRIPNFEVHQEWVSWLRDFVEEKDPENFNVIKTLFDPFFEGNAAEAQKAFSKLLLEPFSCLLYASSLPEKVYQVFLFGLFLYGFGKKSHVVDMEKEAGFGRYGIRYSPTVPQPSIRNQQPEIIIKLKAVSLSKKEKNRRVKKTRKELENHMDRKLKGVMEKLDSRAYYLKSGEHVITVHEFAICFAGRLCVVGSRTRAKDGTSWTVKNYTESEIKKQQFDPAVEEKLEKQDILENDA
ncbi:hypothetical protein CPB86DRAFT_786397, partial [Serendipita vermifera]